MLKVALHEVGDEKSTVIELLMLHEPKSVPCAENLVGVENVPTKAGETLGACTITFG